MVDCTNPSCKCQSIPKVRDDQYEDWTLRSAETKARFGLSGSAGTNGTEQAQDSPNPRCRWCMLEMMGGVEHPVWHDDGTVYVK